MSVARSLNEQAAKKQPAVLLGFDYGARRIGVAVGQQLTRSATPIVTLTTRDGKPDWEAITRLVQEWRPDALVVGVPLTDDEEHPVARAARRFGAQLKQRYGLPVHTVDERLSSHAAERGAEKANRRAGKKTAIDHLAAQVILQTWLDEHHHA